MFQTKDVKEIKTRILCPTTSFFENRAMYETMWKNMVQTGRPQMTIWRMSISHCIPKATYTHTECEIHIAFPLQQWLHERAPVLRYMFTVNEQLVTVSL
jgi:hypothetical protein